MTGAPHLRAGARAEQFVRTWLEAHGLRCLDRNFRCRIGEIDLVMRDERCLVFVEVRYRESDAYGGPLASISPAKQRRIVRAASVYLMQHRALQNWPARFDVVGVLGDLSSPVVDWRQRAFDADVS